MDNPIFRKLQEAIERPCRSKDWFALAEQAINTIYGLGERPDILCDTLIKNLTNRVFAKKGKASETPKADKPMDVDDEDQGDGDTTREQGDREGPVDEGAGDEQDTGDAFELSQLLFVVGHVAIKHIVFLELVERELKGQKHERETGEPQSSISFDVVVDDVFVGHLSGEVGVCRSRQSFDEGGERDGGT